MHREELEMAAAAALEDLAVGMEVQVTMLLMAEVVAPEE